LPAGFEAIFVARERLSKTLEGDALSAPIIPARQRGLVGQNEAGLRPA
jgi:hypothetical protein